MVRKVCKDCLEWICYGKFSVKTSILCHLVEFHPSYVLHSSGSWSSSFLFSHIMDILSKAFVKLVLFIWYQNALRPVCVGRPWFKHTQVTASYSLRCFLNPLIYHLRTVSFADLYVNVFNYWNCFQSVGESGFAELVRLGFNFAKSRLHAALLD